MGRLAAFAAVLALVVSATALAAFPATDLATVDRHDRASGCERVREPG